MYIGLILIVIQIAILANITARTSYADSIRQSLDESLERSMSMIRMDADDHFQMYVDQNSDLYDEIYGDLDSATTAGLGKFKSDFVKIFVRNLNPKINSLEVNIFGADEETGLLSVEAIAEFTYLGGQTGKVDTYKTMIINKTVEPNTRDYTSSKDVHESPTP